MVLDDPALLLYTSGTTGKPKAATLTHGNLTWNTVNQLAHFDTASTDRALCIAPLFHAVGLGQVTLPTLFKGGSVDVLEKFDAATVLRLVAEHGITSFSAVPTMLQLMCEDAAWAGADLSSLRHVVYGGSSVNERVARAWLDRGVRVLQGYGMTEAGPGIYMALHEGAGGPSGVGRGAALLHRRRRAPGRRLGRSGSSGRTRAGAARARTARVRRLLEPAAARPRTVLSTAAGSAPVTSCAPTPTAGPTSSTGSRT